MGLLFGRNNSRQQYSSLHTVVIFINYIYIYSIIFICVYRRCINMWYIYIYIYEFLYGCMGMICTIHLGIYIYTTMCKGMCIFVKVCVYDCIWISIYIYIYLFIYYSILFLYTIYINRRTLVCFRSNVVCCEWSRLEILSILEGRVEQSKV